MTSDAAKLASAWADNAMVALASVPDMAEWIVAHRLHLLRLEQLAPEKRRQLQAAMDRRWVEIESRRAMIRDGVG
jgi:hypothetical protein